MAYDESADLWLKLDVVTEITYGRPVNALRTPLATACLENRRRSGPAFIPSPEDELVTLLLHCVLDKGEFTSVRRRRLETLRHEITGENRVSAALTTLWSPAMTWPKLAALIDAGDWAALLAQRREVAVRLAGRDVPGTLFRLVRGLFLRRLDRWAGLLQPRAPNVALLGPDGAGKSTLAACIQRSFHSPVRSVYMGLYQDSTEHSNRSRVSGLGLAARLLTQWRRYLTARYHQARGRLVLFDRYTYDMLLAPHNRSPLRRLRRWLLAHACPAPDLVLVLDAPGEVLYARKGEHDVTVLEQQRRRYLELQPHIPQIVVVDATRDAEQVRRRVTSLIWQRYTFRGVRHAHVPYLVARSHVGVLTPQNGQSRGYRICPDARSDGFHALH